MSVDPRDTLLVENARIFFRNFAGKEGKYNAEGDRNFCLALEDDLAQQLARDGWNIRGLESRDPDEPPQPYMQVSVSFKHRPPTIVMITSKGKTTLPEDAVEVLDWADIKNIDLIVNPYPWSVGGRSGVKGYVKSMYITINEDYLALKYADVDDLDALPSRSGRTYDFDGEVVEQKAIGR
jgi:hypothetical protein